MHNQYLSLLRWVGDGIDRELLNFSIKLYPASPIRVRLLLAQAASDQGSAALVISPEKYLSTVIGQSRDIEERHDTEIKSYRVAYARYSRLRMIISWLRALLSILEFVTFVIGYVALLLWAIRYDANSSVHLTKDYSVFGISLQKVLTSERDLLIIVGIATSVLLLISLLRNLMSRLMYLLYRSLQPSARALDQRLKNEFRTIIVDLMRRSQELWHEPMLISDRAPTLVEVESISVFPSETFDEVVDFLDLHVTSAVGIAGSRGAGKSTLLRWLFNTLVPEWITVYLATPATYNALDFARMIFGTTINAILTDYQSGAISVRSRAWNAFIRPFRPRRRSPQEEIVRISNDMLNLILRSKTDQWTTMGGLSAKGASITRQKQITITEREPTHPELIAAFARYLESYRRLGGRKVVITIDELDKLANAEDAIGAVNSLKDLFHMPNTHFVISVSEDALVRFAMRGIPFRDVFDSAFDNIIRMRPPSPEDAWKLLARRTGGFPLSVALFCYAWSGGVPRDLIRAARACVNTRRRLGKPVPVAELAPAVVRHDLKESLDAALTKISLEDNKQGIESMLVLRRNIEGESNPLKEVLDSSDLRRELEVEDGDQDRVMLLQRLALYVDLGRSIVDYFTNNLDEKITARFDEVSEIVRKFARAKLALSTYPSEAGWLLSEALKKIKNGGRY